MNSINRRLRDITKFEEALKRAKEALVFEVLQFKKDIDIDKSVPDNMLLYHQKVVGIKSLKIKADLQKYIVQSQSDTLYSEFNYYRLMWEDDLRGNLRPLIQNLKNKYSLICKGVSVNIPKSRLINSLNLYIPKGKQGDTLKSAKVLLKELLREIETKQYNRYKR